MDLPPLSAKCITRIFSMKKWQISFRGNEVSWLHESHLACASDSHAMACFSVPGLHAVARMPTRTACTRRPLQTTRVSLDDARAPSALAGFVSRRVKPHALRHTEQSIWMDQARRHGRALRDTPTPRRWAMAPSNESIPSEVEAFRQACVPRRCVLPLSSLVYDFSCQLPKRRH